jgi:hypothetical protein
MKSQQKKKTFKLHDNIFVDHNPLDQKTSNKLQNNELEVSDLVELEKKIF